MKKILKNSIYVFCIIIYFIVLSYAYTRMNIDRLSEDIKVFSGMFLILGLLSLERAYKRDDGKIAIIGIELLVLAFHSLSIMHMTALLKCDFILYVLISGVVVIVYYILKIIILYTKQRKSDLKNLSDISEIVKKDEPVKKEAKKASEREEELKTKLKEKEEKKEKNKKGENTKKGTKKKKTTGKKEEVKVKTDSRKKTSSKEKLDENKKTTKTKNKPTKKEVNKND